MPLSDLVKAFLVGGGALAATGGLVLYAHQAAAGLPPQAPLPSSGPGSAAPVSQWVTGHSYAFVAPLPQGITNGADLAGSLAGAGWGNVGLLAPWASPNTNGLPAGLAAAQGGTVAQGSYAAQGARIGPTIAVPAGVVSVEIADLLGGAGSSSDGSSSSSSGGSGSGFGGGSPPGTPIPPIGPPPSPPFSGKSALPAATQWVPGLSYELAAPLDASITDGATLEQSLAAAGWHDVTVLWPWSPANVSPHVPPELLAAMQAQGAAVSPGVYVAQGVYLGASIMTVPAGVVSVQVGDLAGTGMPTAPPAPTPPLPPPAVTPPPAPTPPAATATWQDVTGQDMPAGARVRMTIQDADYQAALLQIRMNAANAAAAAAQAQGLSGSQIAQAGGAAGDAAAIGPGTAGMVAWLTLPAVVAKIGQVSFCWGPGDVVPIDWPASPGQIGAVGWKLEFVSIQAVSLSALFAALGIASPTASGVPVFQWMAEGSGSAAPTQSKTNIWGQVDNLQTGDHVRATLATSDFLALEQGLGLNYWSSGSCQSLLSLAQQSAFLQAIQSAQVLVWCGTEYLPPDWPLVDDTSGYHFEFVYGGGAIAVHGTALPFSAAFIVTGTQG